MASLLSGALPVKEGLLQKSASSKGVDQFRGGTWQDRHFRLYEARVSGGARLEYYKKGQLIPDRESS
jgi:hypothetical protein